MQNITSTKKNVQQLIFLFRETTSGKSKLTFNFLHQPCLKSILSRFFNVVAEIEIEKKHRRFD